MTIKGFAALPISLAVFDAFSVVLRESAELILILGALVASLRTANGERWLPWVAAGVLAGCAAGAGLTLWLVSAHIDPRWAAGLTFLLALGVLVLASTLLAAQGAIRARVQVLVEAWLERPSAPLLLLAFSFVASLRETLEAGLFLRGLWLRADGAGVLEGAALGLAGVACLVVAWRGLGVRVGVLAAFRLSAALLSLLAIQMMLGALAEYLAHAAPTSAWARHLRALAAPVLPQGRWFGVLCAVLMLPPVAYILRCWWREAVPRG